MPVTNNTLIPITFIHSLVILVIDVSEFDFRCVSVRGRAAVIFYNVDDTQLLEVLLLMISVHSCELKVPVRMRSLLVSSERGSLNTWQGLTVGLPQGDIVITCTDMTLRETV